MLLRELSRRRPTLEVGDGFAGDINTSAYIGCTPKDESHVLSDVRLPVVLPSGVAICNFMRLHGRMVILSS